MPLIGLIALLIALPILGILAAWLGFNAEAADILVHQAQTVLPGYLGTSLIMGAAVMVLVVVLGALTASAVTLFDFKGRRFFEWALLLPMAMPAYVSAYAYTDFWQYSGALQTALRGLNPDLRLPEIRSLWGAVFLFSFTLYPYTYLLARNALKERGMHLMEAARLLGTPLWERIIRVALPLARPALMAGAALALMETLADYGVSSYFGLATFTTGIYKAWTVLDNHTAAAQLSTGLLGIVALLMWLERSAQRRMRFATVRGRGAQSDSSESRPLQLRGAKLLLAWLACGMPILLGFVLPVAILLRLFWSDAALIDYARYAEWTWNSARFGLLAALLATALAFALGFMLRLQQAKRIATGGVIYATIAQRIAPVITRMAAMGYAIPGAVIAIGILLPVATWQQHFPDSRVGVWLTGTALGMMYAYLVRFTAVAVQSTEAGYARIPTTLDDAARMLGCSRWRLAWRVHAPLLWRSLLTGFLMVFVDVVKELPATLVLRPFDTDTLAVITYNLARDERLGELALPALTIVAVGLIPVVLVVRALERRG